MVAMLLLGYSQESITSKPAEDETEDTVLFQEDYQSLGTYSNHKTGVGLKCTETGKEEW